MHLATCPDRPATHLNTATWDDDPFPAPGRAKPFVPEPEERWEVETGAAVDHCQPTVAPIFRTVQGMTPSERRRYYRSLCANGPLWFTFLLNVHKRQPCPRHRSLERGTARTRRNNGMRLPSSSPRDIATAARAGRSAARVHPWSPD
ncbi:hypothetical protein HPB50_021728 [Hyalomma asiaticum]|uniref:Uncharacterized protein n=1 Tax=Hyalomma asiaticum TaxID=266040 RepID=A0ACB7TKY8_HYAAI|nr:hypothetical protein HPB50_021728 [Hyalomma asiaticum]